MNHEATVSDLILRALGRGNLTGQEIVARFGSRASARLQVLKVKGLVVIVKQYSKREVLYGLKK